MGSVQISVQTILSDENPKTSRNILFSLISFLEVILFFENTL